MRSDRGSTAVAALIHATIAESTDVCGLQHLLGELLARPGRIFAKHSPAKWPVFVLETCQAFAGNRQAAVAAAAAIECVLAAADIVDDLVDGEWEQHLEHSSRALNGSLALSFLALRCLDPIANWIEPRRAWLIRDLIAQGVVHACAGEDLDLDFEGQPGVTEEQALEMTRRKSGSLMAMACRVGAAVATDEDAVLALVGSFGERVGVIAQLLNDMGGIEPNSAGRGSDIARRKKTLPVAYALRCAREEGIGKIIDWYHATPGDSQSTIEATGEEAVARAMADVGALHYTWVVADAHRREALACVTELERVTALPSVRNLRGFIPSLRARQSAERPRQV